MQAQCSGASSSIRSTSKVTGFEYHRLDLWMVVLPGYEGGHADVLLLLRLRVKVRAELLSRHLGLNAICGHVDFREP